MDYEHSPRPPYVNFCQYSGKSMSNNLLITAGCEGGVKVEEEDDCCRIHYFNILLCLNR